jgi:hypothetical protein
MALIAILPALGGAPLRNDSAEPEAGTGDDEGFHQQATHSVLRSA